MPDPTTQELEVEQLRREREEQGRAERAPTDAARRAAQRRADKAAYLREKLAEQEAADEPPGPRAR